MAKDSLADFQRALHSLFQVETEAGAVTIQLVKVENTTSSPQIEQFSLLFTGPATPFLPQQLYRMQHEELGELVLFMVPIGREKDGYLYEIVFNRLIEG
ncbi:DUF6916 family protein [Paenibacillus sp. NPDC056579]|uniref:DUF6916 family protein n=1 Tax=Paenibacillus sp. NPDC056579 TaxID=3345871 RepID=UPI0036BF609C